MPIIPKSRVVHGEPNAPTMASYTGFETFPKPAPKVLPLGSFGSPKPDSHVPLSDTRSDLLHAQYRLSFLQWNAGTARRQPTQLVTAMCGAFNGVLLQEAADHVPHVSGSVQHIHGREQLSHLAQQGHVCDVVHFYQASLLDPALRVAHPVPMSDFARLMVPRRAHAVELSHDERALAWALLIESGHIPLRTMLGTCSRDLYRPLLRRHLVWTQRIIFQEMYNVWTLIQANRG